MASNTQPDNGEGETITDFMKFQCISMQLTAIFPRNRHYARLSQPLAHLLQRAYFVLIFSSCFHITLMLILTLSQTWEDGFEASVYFLSQLIVYTLMPGQLVYFQWHAGECYKLIDYMNRQFAKRSARGLTYVTAWRSYRWARTFTTLYTGFAVFCCLQYLIAPIMSEKRMLLIECWYPFDPLQTPIYQLLLLIQTLAQAIIAIMFANSLNFSLGVSQNICAQFDILHCNLRNLEHTFALRHGRHMSRVAARLLRNAQSRLNAKHIDETNSYPFSVECAEDLSDILHDVPETENVPPTSPERTPFSWQNSGAINRLLHSYVRHHQHLAHCAERLEAVIHPILLCKFVVVTVQLCILALNVTTIEHSTSEIMNELLYLIAVMGDTFYNAHAGQILLDQSVRLRDFLYEIRWYRMDRKLRQDMLFILMFGCRPLQLTGGKFFVMNYEKFVSMIKLSFSFYTLLTPEEE